MNNRGIALVPIIIAILVFSICIIGVVITMKKLTDMTDEVTKTYDNKKNTVIDSTDKKASTRAIIKVPQKSTKKDIIHSKYEKKISLGSLGRKKIAFTVWEGEPGDSNIYISNLDGTDKELLIKHARYPRWSPNGRDIAFWGFDEGHKLKVINIKDKKTKILSDRFGIAFSWSLDGKQLCFDTIGEEKKRRLSNLCLINSNGTGFRKIVSDLKDSYLGIFQFLKFWRKGQRIFFRGHFHNFKGAGEVQDIFYFDLDSNKLINLTQSPNIYEYDFAISPDGNKLAIIEGRDKEERLYLYDLINNNKIKLFAKKTIDKLIVMPKGYISWAPNGKEILSIIEYYNKNSTQPRIWYNIECFGIDGKTRRIILENCVPSLYRFIQNNRIIYIDRDKKFNFSLYDIRKKRRVKLFDIDIVKERGPHMLHSGAPWVKWYSVQP